MGCLPTLECQSLSHQPPARHCCAPPTLPPHAGGAFRGASRLSPLPVNSFPVRSPCSRSRRAGPAAAAAPRGAARGQRRPAPAPPFGRLSPNRGIPGARQLCTGLGRGHCLPPGHRQTLPRSRGSMALEAPRVRGARPPEVPCWSILCPRCALRFAEGLRKRGRAVPAVPWQLGCWSWVWPALLLMSHGYVPVGGLGASFQLGNLREHDWQGEEMMNDWYCWKCGKGPSWRPPWGMFRSIQPQLCC